MVTQYNIESEDRRSFMASEPSSSWGGKWTEEKLDAFEKYVNAYLTIMNKHRDNNLWELIYFDGFAGSGSRNEETTEDGKQLMLNLIDEQQLSEVELTPYKGAAERVLNIKQRGFDYYYFVDLDEKSNAALEARLEPLRNGKKLVFRPHDANQEIVKLANAMHQNNTLKALVLLDPFGMQVDWDSIKQLQHTGTDLWILIPTGVIINRLLERKIDQQKGLAHAEKLETFFGMSEEEIRSFFYTEKMVPTLFGDDETVITKAENSIRKIAQLYVERLKGIFRYVTEDPMVLYNNHNVPIFHLVFAARNKTAMKIAQDIIKKQ